MQDTGSCSCQGYRGNRSQEYNIKDTGGYSSQGSRVIQGLSSIQDKGHRRIQELMIHDR